MNANAPAFVSRPRRALRKRAGQTVVEYALVLCFISVVSITVLSVMGVQIHGVYSTIINALDTVRTAI